MPSSAGEEYAVQNADDPLRPMRPRHLARTLAAEAVSHLPRLGRADASTAVATHRHRREDAQEFVAGKNKNEGQDGAAGARKDLGDYGAEAGEAVVSTGKFIL